MPDKNSDTQRFGGPGSSHQDREHPGKNHQPTGRKAAGETNEGPSPGSPTNKENSRVSGGGGERDTHHTHTAKRS